MRALWTGMMLALLGDTAVAAEVCVSLTATHGVWHDSDGASAETSRRSRPVRRARWLLFSQCAPEEELDGTYAFDTQRGGRTERGAGRGRIMLAWTTDAALGATPLDVSFDVKLPASRGAVRMRNSVRIMRPAADPQPWAWVYGVSSIGTWSVAVHVWEPTGASPWASRFDADKGWGPSAVVAALAAD